jgi:hypothetical protein
MDTCDGWHFHPAVTGLTLDAQVAYADALMSRIRYQASRLATRTWARWRVGAHTVAQAVVATILAVVITVCTFWIMGVLVALPR